MVSYVALASKVNKELCVEACLSLTQSARGRYEGGNASRMYHFLLPAVWKGQGCQCVIGQTGSMTGLHGKDSHGSKEGDNCFS